MGRGSVVVGSQSFSTHAWAPTSARADAMASIADMVQLLFAQY